MMPRLDFISVDGVVICFGAHTLLVFCFFFDKICQHFLTKNGHKQFMSLGHPPFGLPTCLLLSWCVLACSSAFGSKKSYKGRLCLPVQITFAIFALFAIFSSSHQPPQAAAWSPTVFEHL
jgi:hypothetical protein